MLVAAHLEQGTNDVETISEIFEGLGLVIGTVSTLRKMIYHALAVAVSLLRS